MNWKGPADFFAMGGYGLYVWGAYAVTAAYMAFDAVAAIRRHRDALRAHDDDGDDDGRGSFVERRVEVTA